MEGGSELAVTSLTAQPARTAAEEASHVDEAQAEAQRAIYPLHPFGSERTQAFHESLLIHGTNLIREHDGIHFHAAFWRQDEHLRGIERFFIPGCDGAHNGNGAVAVGNIILDDERWPHLLDLGSDGGIELDEIN